MSAGMGSRPAQTRFCDGKILVEGEIPTAGISWDDMYRIDKTGANIRAGEIKYHYSIVALIERNVS